MPDYHLNHLRQALTSTLRYYFSVNKDISDLHQTAEGIRSGAEFKGANLWVLIFAIFIASLGLNTNSTAVIIGAMLISPLMGPIIGMGLAAGISDFALMKKSLRNYAVATVISIITATLYFATSPLSEAQSELLARTSPTIYDVFIAIFGGAAGILALSTRGNTNVIPGVAIATALMPPLCTAGFGLASGNWLYFLGAFYLYFINTVFIAFATYVGVRMMRFPTKSFPDKSREKKVQRYLLTVIIVTMCPSIYMTYTIVRQTIFSANVNNFIQTEMSQMGATVISKETDYKSQKISLTLIGRELSERQQDSLRGFLKRYHLENARLTFIQGYHSKQLPVQQILSAEQSKTALLTEQHNKEVRSLKEQLRYYENFQQLSLDLRPEVAILFPQTSDLHLAPVLTPAHDSVKADTFVLATTRVKSKLSAEERTQLQRWLQQRIATDSLQLVIQ
ncbi:MAG: DUF389 domain-containing protein [Bacteroidaceae bacterium]|nr:DUF389 domain-containing protein [Bacteroidaceae bacterium]